jgi:hypothetical protein
MWIFFWAFYRSAFAFRHLRAWVLQAAQPVVSSNMYVCMWFHCEEEEYLGQY